MKSCSICGTKICEVCDCPRCKPRPVNLVGYLACLVIGAVIGLAATASGQRPQVGPGGAYLSPATQPVEDEPPRLGGGFAPPPEPVPVE